MNQLSKFRLLNDYVLVEPEPRELIVNGIHVPENWGDKTDMGYIREIGSKLSQPLKIGDRVFIQRMGNTEIELDDKKYKIVRIDDVWATVNL